MFIEALPTGGTEEAERQTWQQASVQPRPALVVATPPVDELNVTSLHAADRQLARQVARGSEAAFNRFFELYYPRVFRFCLRRINEQDAEEVAQQVFLQALRAVGKYRGEASLFTWLCQIARFEISARFRREERRPATVSIDDDLEFRADLESLFEEPEHAPESLAMTGQAQALVELVLDHLPSDYGRILELKYMEGCSVDEIVARLGGSFASVQSKLARARGAFREQYALAQASMPGVVDNERRRP